VVFTGKGTPPPAPLVEKGQTIYVLFWNLETTIFNLPNVVPVAFKIDSILIGHNVLPPEQRQVTR